jgi:outer membrane receptor for ferric coprogen and ferric-rhodotorulic acid
MQPIDQLSVRISGSNAIHKFLVYEESGTDFANKKMPQAPEWIANAQITYKPACLKGFRLSLEWQHIDEYFMDALNTKTYEGYDILNLRLGYERNGFEIWTNILNATNQLYATVVRANAWGETYSVGNPRNVNIGIGYKFSKK